MPAPTRPRPSEPLRCCDCCRESVDEASRVHPRDGDVWVVMVCDISWTTRPVIVSIGQMLLLRRPSRHSSLTRISVGRVPTHDSFHFLFLFTRGLLQPFSTFSVVGTQFACRLSPVAGHPHTKHQDGIRPVCWAPLPFAHSPLLIRQFSLGRSGLKVSKVILGAMQYGDPAWQEWVLREEEALPLLEYAYKVGINTWDPVRTSSTRRRAARGPSASD